jgi:hypothetical protein
MEASAKASSSTGLLALPRELRDAVLENLLVKGTISLACTVSRMPRYKVAESDDVEVDTKKLLLHVYPWGLLRSPCIGRSTWITPLTDEEWSFPINLYSAEGELLPESNACDANIEITYQLAERTSPFDLNVMLVCKQLYLEATEILYSKNKFSFTADFRLRTAYYFLQDRSRAALTHTRQLELCLLENEILNLESDQLEEVNITIDYEYYSRLCSLISSPSMSLRHLTLGIETSITRYKGPQNYDLGDDSISESLLNEEADPVGTPTWLDPLLSIKRLETVTVWWHSRNALLKRTGRTLSIIRYRLLRDKLLDLETSNTTGRYNIEYHACMLQAKPGKGNYVFHKGAALTYISGNDQLQRRDCVVGFDQKIRLIETDRGQSEEELVYVDREMYPSALPANLRSGILVYCKLQRK